MSASLKLIKHNRPPADAPGLLPQDRNPKRNVNTTRAKLAPVVSAPAPPPPPKAPPKAGPPRRAVSFNRSKSKVTAVRLPPVAPLALTAYAHHCLAVRPSSRIPKSCFFTYSAACRSAQRGQLATFATAWLARYHVTPADGAACSPPFLRRSRAAQRHAK